MADLAKLGKELKKMAQSLNGNFSSDGPFKQRTARLQKIAAAAVTSYKKALTGSSGSSTRVNVGEKKEAKTSTSELVDETIEIAGEIKTFSNQVLLFGQVVLVAHIFKITYERIKKRRSSKM